VSEFIAPETLYIFVSVEVTVASPVTRFIAFETQVMFLWTSDSVFLHTWFYNDFITVIVTIVHSFNSSP